MKNLKKTKKLKERLLILFSVLLFLSCGQVNLAGLEKNFRDIQITTADDSATVIMFIQLFNENDFDLEISSIDYELFIDERPCAHGSLNQSVTIKSAKNMRISLPLWVPYAQLDKVSKSALQNRLKTPVYKLTGELTLMNQDDKEKKQGFVVTNK